MVIYDAILIANFQLLLVDRNYWLNGVQIVSLNDNLVD